MPGEKEKGHPHHQGYTYKHSTIEYTQYSLYYSKLVKTGMYAP